MKKTMKKILCGALAAVSVFGCATMMTGCKTAHPEVQMKLSFNGETYTLTYKLYRKVAPATVKHFMKLVEEDYYDGMCIHDYDTTQDRMHTGGFTLSATDNTAIEYKPYFDIVSKYSKFPHSVWFDEQNKEYAYTLKGEFKESNGFEVKNGELKQTFGSLTMFYHTIENEALASQDVYTVRGSDDGELNIWDYQYNCATSMFFISLSETTKSSGSYCTFATLNKKGKSNLRDLQEAIDEYVADYYDADAAEFTKTVYANVFQDDPIVNGAAQRDEEFSIPKQPIVIKSMKVTKY